MNSFDKWKEEYGLQSEPNYSEHTEKDCKSAFEAGQQSQQAKIGILQIKLNGADERAAAVLNHKNKMIDELQARNDYLSKKFNDIARLILDECEDILKGNKQHIHKFEEITVNGDDARKYICIYCGFEKSESFNDH